MAKITHFSCLDGILCKEEVVDTNVIQDHVPYALSILSSGQKCVITSDLCI